MRDATERTSRFVGDNLWIPAGFGRVPATFAIATLSVIALLGVFWTTSRLTVVAAPSATRGVDGVSVCTTPYAVQAIAQPLCGAGSAIVPGVQPVAPVAGAGISADGSQDLGASAELNSMVPACAGDGTSGNRVAFYYAYFSGQQNRLGAVRKNLIAVIEEANDIVYQSARMHGSDQSLRIVTDANCVPVIRSVELPASDADSFQATVRDSNLSATDRKYVLFTDSARYCGVGTMNLDDRPGSDNTNNGGPSWARVDLGCWDPQSTVRAIFRMLGAVQGSAPHYTGAGHCADGFDVICQTQAPGSRAADVSPGRGGPAEGSCADPAMADRLDCAGDTYYNPAPPSGSYLASHWNTADSSFLYGGEQSDPLVAAKASAVMAAGQP